ncbi:MAG TPA: hypothetical protein VIX86_01365 [Streptosporangiaceae bacterium]
MRSRRLPVLLVAVLAAGFLAAGCGGAAGSAIKSLAPSASISLPSRTPGSPAASSQAPTPTATAQPSVTPSAAAPAPSPAARPSKSAVTPAASGGAGSSLLWLWILLGAIAVIAVVALIIRSSGRRSAAATGWRSNVIDAYAKGSALYDAMSVAEGPGALGAEDSGARWTDIQRRADDLAQALYTLREAAPDDDSRMLVADVLGSLQAVRSAMTAERAPEGGPAGQAEIVRSRLFAFDAALRRLRAPDQRQPY